MTVLEAISLESFEDNFLGAPASSASETRLPVEARLRLLLLRPFPMSFCTENIVDIREMRYSVERWSAREGEIYALWEDREAFDELSKGIPSVV